jgi:hypothetical protein
VLHMFVCCVCCSSCTKRRALSTPPPCCCHKMCVRFPGVLWAVLGMLPIILAAFLRRLLPRYGPPLLRLWVRGGQGSAVQLAGASIQRGP